MCQAHMPKSAGRGNLSESSQPFLERCCELGLVRRENQNGTTHYFPTTALAVFDTSE